MFSSSTFVYSTPLADRECACVAKVAIRYVYMCLIYIYIATIRLPNSACQNWECACVDEVACSMYVYASMDIVAIVYTYCCYLICVYASDIHIYIVTSYICWCACQCKSECMLCDMCARRGVSMIGFVNSHCCSGGVRCAWLRNRARCRAGSHQCICCFQALTTFICPLRSTKTHVCRSIPNAICLCHLTQLTTFMCPLRS